jgi:hypothetical protein
MSLLVILCAGWHKYVGNITNGMIYPNAKEKATEKRDAATKERK